MEPRRYSTGTKGRLARHADACRDLVHRSAPGFHLATEFIESIDPAGDDGAWQRFEEPDDLLPFLRSWLRGEDPPAKPATKTPPPPQAFLRLARHWLDSPSTRTHLSTLEPLEAAERMLAEVERLAAPRDRPAAR